jgi:hypothetical protein
VLLGGRVGCPALDVAGCRGPLLGRFGAYWDIVGDILMAVGIAGVLIAIVSMAAVGRNTTTGTTEA